MQAQVKYKSEVKTAVLGDRTITVKNLTPVFSPQEQVRGRQRYNILVGWLPTDRKGANYG